MSTKKQQRIPKRHPATPIMMSFAVSPATTCSAVAPTPLSPEPAATGPAEDVPSDDEDVVLRYAVASVASRWPPGHAPTMRRSANPRAVMIFVIMNSSARLSLLRMRPWTTMTSGWYQPHQSRSVANPRATRPKVKLKLLSASASHNRATQLISGPSKVAPWERGSAVEAGWFRPGRVRRLRQVTAGQQGAAPRAPR